MRTSSRRIGGVSRTVLAVAFVAAGMVALAEEPVYKQPAKPVLDALTALPTPGISVSPQRDYAVLTQSVRYPSINDVAQPMLRLAGIRIDTNTNGMHLPQSFISFSIRRLSDGTEIKGSFPANGRFSSPIWSPDGKQFAFTNTLS